MIEKRLIGQLGERFQHATLIELSRQSYLILNNVRIPIFGRKANIIERTPESISKKSYLLMKDSEFYTNQRILGQTGYTNLANHRYVLDTRRKDYNEKVATADGSVNDIRLRQESMALKQETLGNLEL